MLDYSSKARTMSAVAIALAAGASAAAAPAPVVEVEKTAPVSNISQRELSNLPVTRRIQDLILTCPTETIPTVSATPQPASPTAADINCVRPDDIQMIDVFKAHNLERARFGYHPLRWNPLLAQHAQGYANQLAQTGQLVHSSREGRGIERENLSKGLLGWNTNQLTRSWFDERRYFKPGIFPNVSTSGDWYQVGHYSQIVWPTTTDIGCGRSQGSGFSWLVCRYSPGGNRDGMAVGFPPPILAQPPVININNSPPAAPQQPLGKEAVNQPAPRTPVAASHDQATAPNFSTKRRVAFCGHMWIIVDTYDKQGKKTGELSLHFSPSGYEINPTSQDAYPKGFAVAVDSTRDADQRLVEMWRYQIAHQSELVHLPVIGPWSPGNNCWTQSLWWAWYGIEPNEPVHDRTDWPTDCTISPAPDWTEKSRRLHKAWDKAETVAEHFSVIGQYMEEAYRSAKDFCAGSDGD